MVNKKSKVLDITFDNLTLFETVDLVDKKIAECRGAHILGINADKINQLNEMDDAFSIIVKKADVINADGISVVLASKYLGKGLVERVAGIDLMQELLKIAELRGYGVYFLGAKETSLEKMLGNLSTMHPSLKIVGARNGYFEKTEWASVAKTIEKACPHIVFIGITSPQKEYLIDYFMNEGIKSVFMGVGGSFDVLSGEIKRAPLWTQKIHFEWVYRLLQEPNRLGKRYLVGNIKFLIHVFKEKKKDRKENMLSD